jgi:hypothetical protein
MQQRAGNLLYYYYIYTYDPFMFKIGKSKLKWLGRTKIRRPARAASRPKQIKVAGLPFYCPWPDLVVPKRIFLSFKMGQALEMPLA